MESIAHDASHSGEQVRMDLLAETLRQHGEARLVGLGCSMIPSIYPGDLITVRAASPSEISTGEVVLVFRERRFWIHRLVCRVSTGKEFLLTTKGDALDQTDPRVGSNQILGRVIRIDRYGRVVEPQAAVLKWIFSFLLRRSNLVVKLFLASHSLRTRWHQMKCQEPATRGFVAEAS
jgi:signal peptidase I